MSEASPGVALAARDLADANWRGEPTSRRKSARIACALGVAFTLLLAGSVSAADAVVIGGNGKRGPSVTYAADCKYGSRPYPGYLKVTTWPPKVAGAPSRPGREWVRFRAWLVNPSGYGVGVWTDWSAWLRVRDDTWATWSGTTSLTADWRGNYRMDVAIEWWNNTRRIGWRTHRITDYYYIDEWNTSWGGPFPSCMRQPV